MANNQPVPPEFVPFALPMEEARGLRDALTVAIHEHDAGNQPLPNHAVLKMRSKTAAEFHRLLTDGLLAACATTSRDCP